VPPDLDIYALTRHRERATIERFLDEYVDRVASEVRGDEELMLETPESLVEDRTGDLPRASSDAAYEWEPAYTLSHIIERGLDHPRRAFTVYLTAKDPDMTRVILAFTRDDLLVLGLAIDDEGVQPANELKAKALLARLMVAYHCHAGLIVVEHYPPHSEREFRARASEASSLVLYATP
jgi:hypothetical protein